MKIYLVGIKFALKFYGKIRVQILIQPVRLLEFKEYFLLKEFEEFQSYFMSEITNFRMARRILNLDFLFFINLKDFTGQKGNSTSIKFKTPIK